MWHHLRMTLIGAAILVGVTGAIMAIVGGFMLIPEYPLTMGAVVFILLARVVGLIVTDNTPPTCC